MRLKYFIYIVNDVGAFLNKSPVKSNQNQTEIELFDVCFCVYTQTDYVIP